MSDVTCPKCGAIAKKGGIQWWQVAASILLFPAGLITFVYKRTIQCSKCGYVKAEVKFKWVWLFATIGSILGWLCTYLLFAQGLSFDEWLLAATESPRLGIPALIGLASGLFIGIIAGMIIDKLSEK